MLCSVLLLCLLSPTASSFQSLGVFHHQRLQTKRSRQRVPATLFATLDPIPAEKHEPLPPPYKPLDYAFIVFSDVYFYENEEEVTQFRDERYKILGNLTVGEVYKNFTLNSQSVESGLRKLANAIRALDEPILKYFASASIPPEQVLGAKKRIDLSDGGEFRVFDDRVVDQVPALEDIWSTTMNRRNSLNETMTRGLRLGLVLGPSGSGKTFFALQYLSSKFLTSNATAPEKDTVTLYLKAAQTGIKFNNQTNAAAATELLAWIRKEVLRREKVAIEETLGMHVCLIIDEAGCEEVKWWFEDKAMLTALCAEAGKLAKSVAVVVSGTGLTGRELSFTNDAFVFRMKRWEIHDLARVLEVKAKTNLFLETHETTETVAKAIFAHPELGALATNGRAAFFLLNGIQTKSKSYSRVSWPYQLDEWAPALVADVVYDYITSNGLSNIDRIPRYRVAGSIFRALNGLKAGVSKLPTLDGIEKGRETAAALSLLQYNLEIDGTLKILKGEKFAFTVTPAIAIVLYTMAGISTSLIPGWKGEEKVAALYTCSKWILDCMESFLSTVNEQNADQSALDTNHFYPLEQSLGRLRLVLLRKRVEPSSKVVSGPVPMVGVGTILVNGDMASFADVISPYCLIQAKRVTPKSNLDLDLFDELKKCSLTVCIGKKDRKDTRLLQGLVATWRGDLDPRMFAEKQDNANSKDNLYKQMSQAFPGNVLGVDSRTEDEKIRYASIEGLDATENTIDNGTKLPLPSMDGITLTFIVSTNAKTIKLKLSSRTTLEITEAHVHDDLSLNANKLNKPQRLAWARFLKNKVRQGVKIQFLFTRTVRPGS